MKLLSPIRSVIIIIILLLFHSAYAQQPAAQDTLLYLLQKIKNADDTASVNQAYQRLFTATEQELLNNNIATQIIDLKLKLEDADYYDFMQGYFVSLARFNTIASNTKAIEVGQLFMQIYSPDISEYGHYSLLILFRNMRIPYRLLGKINESIEYYGAYEKIFLAANDSDAVSIVTNVLSGSYFRLGLIEKACYYQLKSISFLNDSEFIDDVNGNSMLFGKYGKVNRFAVLGSYYVSEHRPDLAEPYLVQSIDYYKQLDSPLLMLDAPYLFLQMARCKTQQKSDSSSIYYDTALQYFNLYNSTPLEYAHFYQEKAVDFISKNALDSAMHYIIKASAIKDSLQLGISSYFGDLIPDYYKGSIYVLQGKPKQAISFLEKECNNLKPLNIRVPLINSLDLLAKAYADAGDNAQAYATLKEAFDLKTQNAREINDTRILNFETEKKMQENETALLLLAAQNKSDEKIKLYLKGMLLLLALLAVSLGIFYTNKKKSNKQLTSKNLKLAHTLDQLQATQALLIQSEKMASLGELTAGIAHEIQNPLNFVNNFSELNEELLGEMKDELSKGKTDEAIAIANDLIENERKINHHGKRADAIVKGMLQHSRISSGRKESVDINALCDEYLRLAYHGLRAKDKSFTANFKTDFDNALHKIDVVPQDIGRAILNIINNAFYAVNEKGKQHIPGYEPHVFLSTKKSNGNIEIIIRDNGNGIPESIIEKIFQPFFTTKPTGEGTGLGLSLSYDIIKAHGGKLAVRSKVNEETEFTIQLPIQ